MPYMSRSTPTSALGYTFLPPRDTGGNRSTATSALGDVSAGTTAIIATGANVVVPGSGPIVAVGVSILNSLFGGNQDAVRQARETWFEQGARQGSVTAARILIGGTINTASHESPMYQAGINRLLNNPATAPTMAAAIGAGPYWDTTDNATSDKMRALVEAELRQQGTPTQTPAGPGQYVQGPTTTVPTTPSSAPQQRPQQASVFFPSSSSITPYLIAGGGILAAAFILPNIFRPSRRR